MEAEEHEEIKLSCRTTKTILHGDPIIRDYIYKRVTATYCRIKRELADGEQQHVLN
jgi:hypothetical protein